MVRRRKAAGSASPQRADSRFERQARAEGFGVIAGVDEVGRGCLFGPVVAAAVVLDPARTIQGLADSKTLDADRRELLAERICERAVAWATAAVDAAWIDRVNIYQASRLAMQRAVAQLSVRPDYLLVDAMRLDLPIEQQSLIRGDARCRSIAAASIVAKVVRDRSMTAWRQTYPGYGLESNKGYGTPEHLAGLERLGPTPAHRMSFAPVRAAARGPQPVADPQFGLFSAAGAR